MACEAEHFKGGIPPGSALITKHCSCAAQVRAESRPVRQGKEDEQGVLPAKVLELSPCSWASADFMAGA